MSPTRNLHGKISDHFKGLGAATQDLVIQRAREIAIINGRTPNCYNDDDFLQAKHELLGADHAEEGEFDFVASLTQWDENPASHGHAARRAELPDEQTLPADLAQEGLWEAEHKQMLAGARRRNL